MYNHKLYLSYWFVSFLTLMSVSWMFPTDIVLGNWKFSVFESAIYASFWLTFFIWVIWDFLYARGVRYEKGMSTFLYFWAVNSVGIWIIARLAHLLGLGISGWFWAISMGLVANLLQRSAWRWVTKKQLGV